MRETGEAVEHKQSSTCAFGLRVSLCSSYLTLGFCFIGDCPTMPWSWYHFVPPWEWKKRLVFFRFFFAGQVLLCGSFKTHRVNVGVGSLRKTVAMVNMEEDFGLYHFTWVLPCHPDWICVDEREVTGVRRLSKDSSQEQPQFERSWEEGIGLPSGHWLMSLTFDAKVQLCIEQKSRLLKVLSEERLAVWVFLFSFGLASEDGWQDLPDWRLPACTKLVVLPSFFRHKTWQGSWIAAEHWGASLYSGRRKGGVEGVPEMGQDEAVGRCFSFLLCVPINKQHI